jgi:AmmeMemoRadiSam system protein B
MKKKTIRPPAVAGVFYPADRDGLLNEVHKYLLAAPGEGEPEKVRGAVSPHAGYYYSGHVAGAVFGSIAVPDRVIIIGPNHRGLGAPVALDDSDEWLFPFGTVPTDKEAFSIILDNSATVEPDTEAHAWEHSLEVIVPFLFVRNHKVSITAICMGTHDAEKIADVASAVAVAARETGALVVASSDMTHYMPDAVARRLDGLTIETIERMDVEGMMERVESEGALCGGASVASAMLACEKNGADRARLVRYATSGDIEDKRDSVVGYGGFLIV